MSSITPHQQQSSAEQDDPRSPVVKELRRLDRTLKEISSLKQKQDSGGVLLPDQEVKVARESAVLQSLHDLQLQHPDAAASFASLMSAHKSDSPKAGAGPLRGSFADDVLESPVDSDMAGACAQQCIEFDCRRNCGAAALTPSPRINAVPAIFMRETHYIGRYDGEGIDFACPRLVVELPSCSVATPSSLLAALASAEFSGFSDVRFTAELWEQPPTTPAGDFNVMTHAWMFGHLNLAEKLKNNSDIIIGAFEPIGIDASPAAAARPPARAGGGPATATGGDNKHALRINSISRSRVSLHMKWGSPAFSPNNCKLRLKNGSGLSSFWLLKGDPATRRAMVSFICLLPPASSAAFVDVMSQQRQCASSAPDAPPGAARVSLHTLLSCLQSHPSVSDAAAALGAVLIASDDDASLCVAPHGSTAAPLQQSTEPSENTGGAGAAQQGPPSAGGCGSAQLQLSPGAIHDAIKDILAIHKDLGVGALKRMLLQQRGWTVSENGIKKVPRQPTEVAVPKATLIPSCVRDGDGIIMCGTHASLPHFGQRSGLGPDAPSTLGTSCSRQTAARAQSIACGIGFSPT